MTQPKPTAGIRHIALTVRKLEACERFYVDLLGMSVEWRPDVDNIGFIINELNEVDVWHEYLRDAGVFIKTAPRTHRDKTRSFYCEDPDGNSVQLIFHPFLASK